MKSSPRMQAIITQIAEKHARNLAIPGTHLRLVLTPFMPLVIECIGANQVSVCHYYEQNGDLVQDPEIIFFTFYPEWVALAIQSVHGYHEAATLTPDNQAIHAFQPRAQQEIGVFAETWAQNIEAQGWLEAGQDSRIA